MSCTSAVSGAPQFAASLVPSHAIIAIATPDRLTATAKVKNNRSRVPVTQPSESVVNGSVAPRRAHVRNPQAARWPPPRERLRPSR